jgi:hypothetical protein
MSIFISPSYKNKSVAHSEYNRLFLYEGLMTYSTSSHSKFHHRYHLVWITKYRYWGRRFWARGYFSMTSGNITDDVIQNYILRHLEENEPTDDSR